MALFVAAALLFLGFATTHIARILEDKVDISVYFIPKASEENILDVKSQLLGFEEVKNVEYISQDKALDVFRERHKDNALITASLEELEENPLRASLNIKAYQASSYSSIAEFLSSGSIGSLVEKVDYRENKNLIERLFAITGNIKKAGLAVSAVLSVIAILVAFNTVRLAIYNEKDSIAIMRLVGAGDWFIRGPFIVQGMLVGFFAALLSMLVVTTLIIVFSQRLNALIPGLDMLTYFKANISLFLVVELGGGVVLGSVSSFIAIRNYLKV